MSLIRKIPLPMSALALGLAGLGNLLLSYSPIIRVVCGGLAALFALLVIARLALDTRAARTELASPANLAVLPALFMALMLIATYLKPLAPLAAKGLWVVALVAQLGIVALFLVRHVTRLDLKTVLPAWFLVFVGFVVASVTSPAFDMLPVGRVLLYAGLLGYAVALPLVTTRVIRHPELPAPAVPTLAIFAAPPSLCLVGYLAVAPVKSPAVVYTLLALSATSLLFVLINVPRIVRGGFFPSYAALTFPLVISAIALKQSNAFLAATAAGSPLPKLAVLSMDALATGVVLFVLAHYTVFLAAPAKQSA